ncbi:hypothetical protein QLX08_010538 [Tetragonisca angustula]|uniref:Uncharacterized protein n=1 Tax=Tetragonisca angustula TaxID=166442 RepID=A0AAW0ZDN9_9HYME
MQLTRLEDLPKDMQQRQDEEDAIDNAACSTISSDKIYRCLRNNQRETTAEMSHKVDAVLNNDSNTNIMSLLDEYIGSIRKYTNTNEQQ